MEEIWKKIKGWENLYKIKNKGRGRSLDRKTRNNRAEFWLKGRIMKIHYDRNDRAYVNLSNKDRKMRIYVHQQVARHFVHNPRPNEYIIINHINEDKKDNTAENLEWRTYAYNLNYGSRKHFQKISRGQWLEFKNLTTGVSLCCYSKSDLFKILDLNDGGSNWRKLNKHLEEETEEFYGYKIIQHK